MLQIEVLVVEFERIEQFGRPALRNEEGKTFELREDGLVSFGDVARGLLGQQCQYASRYIDPSFHHDSQVQLSYPNLAVGLRVETGSIGGNYHMYGIHPDDIDEFVARYRAYESYSTGFTSDERGEQRAISEEEYQQFETYLKEVGAI